MKGLSEKFREALAELSELHATDPAHAGRISDAIGQALLFIDKHRTHEFAPTHLASIRWPADPTTEPNHHSKES